MHKPGSRKRNILIFLVNKNPLLRVLGELTLSKRKKRRKKKERKGREEEGREGGRGGRTMKRKETNSEIKIENNLLKCKGTWKREVSDE